MSFAPAFVYVGIGDGTILGRFIEVSNGNLFEFSKNTDNQFTEWPHKIWVTVPVPGIDSGFRYGRVKKTTVCLVTGIDSEGNDVIEKWKIRNHKFYCN